MIAKFAKKINEILIQKEIVQKEDAELASTVSIKATFSSKIR